MEKQPPKQPGALRRAVDWLWRAPASLLVILMVTVLAATTIYGATRQRPERPLPTASASQTPLYRPSPAERTAVAAPEQPKVAAAIAKVAANPDLKVGVAIASVATADTRQQASWHGGTIVDGEAWETISVPIALAITNQAKQPEDRDYIFRRALQQDSAAGLSALWAFLCDVEQASGKTMAELRSRGDWRTIVPVNPTRGYQPYLNSVWRLDDQAEYWAALSCDYRATSQVLGYLDEPDAATAFGLAKLPRAFTKAGKGLNADGDLVVRQAGLISLGGGNELAVALSVSSKSKDEKAAQQAMTDLAFAIASGAAGFPAPRCG